MTRRLSSPTFERRDGAEATHTSWLCRPWYVALLVFLLTGTLAAGLIWRQEQYRMREARNLATSLAAERTHDIQTGVDRVLSATYALAAMVQQGKGVVSNFEVTASRLLRYFPGASALQLAPDGVVRQVVPLVGHEKSIGHDLMHDPARGKEAQQIRDSGQLMLAGPFQSIQGDQAADGRLPVFLEDSQGQPAFWGFAIVLIALPEVLASAGLDELPARGYAYELWRHHPETGDKMVIGSSPTATPSDPVDKAFAVPNATWTLSVAPLGGWTDTRDLWWQSAVGLLFCALLAWQAGWQAKLVAASKAHERTLERRVAQRTADLQRFAEVTAHHLQEPARRVASYAGRLRSQLAGRIEDAEVQVSLDFISQQAARLQELLRDAELYLSADQPRGKIESCAVEPILTDVLGRLAEPIAEAGARVSIGALPSALIDQPRFNDLFRVAIENALRHARSGKPMRIEIGGQCCAGWVRYHVSDNGPGVEAEYRRRVFRVFERLSSSGEGTGVGLAILRRIVESAGGQAWIEEARGGGCRLVLQLPAGDQPSAEVGRS
ncbi:MAG: CHASE domain-containing protein [Candidatus Accumulibacter sp.]|uniref:ATP-binding protein n=1 Tax=Accumulibacter sp. TaxID=2053492 RepID=UPI001A4B57AD|nr:ATP-binding protein [Accumulibacter sp.]MBL8394417.1 CHASE domain-containing protein [Accumulibacter sp.]